MKNIAILGSTGSIGTQALEIIRDNADMRVSSLAAQKNIDLLEKQAREFCPKLVCVYDTERAEELKIRLADTGTRVVSGMSGLIECASTKEADLCLGAIVGMIGIRPTIEAIKAGKDIAFANKETLVTAGHLIMPLVKEKNVKLLPVDSEHSAIFQCLQGEEKNAVKNIYLTASGGPFRGYTREMLEKVTVTDALRHPNWQMGAKITIDSSTMVNKGLEVMEARWLFNTGFDRIKVLIQPKSIIHSMVEFEDGAVKAQLGAPDMKLPIQYAFYYPERRIISGSKALDFDTISSITFEKPDSEVFEALPLAYEVGKKGGNLPTAFNAANEYAVGEFLKGRLSFTGITETIKKVVNNIEFIDSPGLSEILETEKEARRIAEVGI